MKNNQSFWKKIDGNLYLTNNCDDEFYYCDFLGNKVSEDEKIFICNISQVSFIESNLFSDINPIATKRMGFTPKNQLDSGFIGFINVGTLKEEDLSYLNDNDLDVFTDQDSLSLVSPTKQKFISKGDILISFKQSIGFINIFNCNTDCITNEAIDIIQINDMYDKKYIGYQLGNLYKKNAKQNTGSKTLNDTIKNSLKVKIPSEFNYNGNIVTSLMLQKAIAFYIENIKKILNLKIKNLNAMISLKNLEKYFILDDFFIPKDDKNILLLDDMIEERSQKNSNNDILEIFSVENKNGGQVIPYEESTKFTKRENGIENYNVIKKNDIIFNPSRINVGSIGVMKYDIGVISPMYEVFKLKNDNHLNMFKYLLRSKYFLNIVASNMNSKVRPSFKLDKLKKIKVDGNIVNKDFSEVEKKMISISEIQKKLKTQVILIEMSKSKFLGEIF